MLSVDMSLPRKRGYRSMDRANPECSSGLLLTLDAMGLLSAVGRRMRDVVQCGVSQGFTN